MTDTGFPPARFARIWLHTHPGASVAPSPTDEETFKRVFGACDWAVMAILGRTGRTSARLRFNSGPGAAVEIPTAVDWADWPAFALDDDLPARLADWRHEYDTLVEEIVFPTEPSRRDPFADLLPFHHTHPGDRHACF